MNKSLFQKTLVLMIIILFLAVSIVPVSSLSINSVSPKLDEMFENNSSFNSTFLYPVDDIDINEKLSEREIFKQDKYEEYPHHYDEYLRNHSYYPPYEPFYDYPNHENIMDAYRPRFENEYVRNHTLKNRKPTPKPNFAAGKTWYVDDDGGADFTKIQDAIDAASDGDTVYVYSGIYYENVVVDKSIILRGEDKHSTVIAGRNVGDVIEVKSNYINVTSFTIKEGNTGIYLNYGCDEISIYQNIIANNGEYGIFLRDSCHDIITDNSFVDNGIYIMSYYIMDLTPWTTHTIENNYINGKPIYYYKNNHIGMTVPLDTGQVILANCSNFVIKNLYLSNGASIVMGFSSYNNISQNHIGNNFDFSGIILSWRCTNNTISWNKFKNSQGGLCLFIYCDDNIISNNNMENGYAGIWIYAYCNNNIVKDNTVTHVQSPKYRESSGGIVSGGSSNNTICRNNIVNCSGYGILLGDSFDNISNNIVINNEKGGIVGYGYISDIGFLSNSIIHGNIIKDNRKYGIYLVDYRSDNNTISKNIISGNFYDGIVLDGSSDNIISNCTIYSNFEQGISVWGSHDNIISDSIIKNHEYGSGILFENSDDAIIQDCYVSDNMRGGIKLDTFSTGTNITSCLLTHNSWGIDLTSSKSNRIERCTIANNIYGGILEGQNNTVCNNNFIDNYNHYFHKNWYDTNKFHRNYWSGRLLQFPLPYRVFNLNFDWFPKAIPYDYPNFNETILDDSDGNSLDSFKNRFWNGEFNEQNNRFLLTDKLSDRLSSIFSKAADVLNQDHRQVLNRWREGR